jgi:hypothetical protein
MPISLEKLFSDTITVSFPYMDETVNVTWAPARWTGEMQDLAERLAKEMAADGAHVAELRKDAQGKLDAASALEEANGDAAEVEALRSEADALAAEATEEAAELNLRDRRALRDSLVRFLVGWDVLDGDTPLPIDLPNLNRLPDDFLRTLWIRLLEGNREDPQKAPSSDEPSSTEKGSAPSPTGTNTSPRRARSGSARSSSTREPVALATTPSGAPGA